jgi:hypothetical protein
MPPDKTSKRTVVIFILLLLSMLSGVIVFLGTANGPLGYSDSVAYIVSARNLIKGIGLGMFMPSGRFVATYLHPPLYPLLLSTAGIWGIDLVVAARWWGIVMSAATVFTTGSIFFRYSRHAENAILAGSLVMIFPTILTMFMSAMSESLFLFLLSLSCLLLVRYLQDQTKTNFIVTALICGLLPITRYVGFAVFIPAVLCIFLFSSGLWQERLKRLIAFGSLASAPLILWLLVLYFGSNRAFGGRSIQIDGEYLLAGLQTYRETAVGILWSWIPFSQKAVFQVFHPMRGVILLAVFLALSVITWILVRRSVTKDGDVRSDADIQLGVFFGAAVASYYIVFMATWLFTVPQTPINDRLLLPVYFFAVLALLSGWAVWQKATFPANPWMRILPWLFALLMAYWYYPQVTDVIWESNENDTILAYRWRDAEVIRALKALPAGQGIVSNKSETVILWADRPAYDLMENLHPGFIKQDSPYGSDDTDPAQRAFRQGAALVLFSDFTNQFESTYGERGKGRLETIIAGLAVAGRYPEGVIYLYPVK